MTITRIQETTKISGSNTNSDTLTFGSAMTGNVVVVAVSWGNNDVTPVITLPANYIAIGSIQSDGTNVASQLYYKINSLSTTILCSIDNGNKPALYAAEYNFSGTPSLDSGASGQDGAAQTSPHTSPTLNPEDGIEALLIGFFSGPNGGTTFSAESFTGPITGSMSERCDLDSTGAGGSDCHTTVIEQIDTQTQPGNYSFSGTTSVSEKVSQHFMILKNFVPRGKIFMPSKRRIYPVRRPW